MWENPRKHLGIGHVDQPDDFDAWDPEDPTTTDPAEMTVEEHQSHLNRQNTTPVEWDESESGIPAGERRSPPLTSRRLTPRMSQLSIDESERKTSAKKSRLSFDTGAPKERPPGFFSGYLAKLMPRLWGEPGAGRPKSRMPARFSDILGKMLPRRSQEPRRPPPRGIEDGPGYSSTYDDGKVDDYPLGCRLAVLCFVLVFVLCFMLLAVTYHDSVFSDDDEFDDDGAGLEVASARSQVPTMVPTPLPSPLPSPMPTPL